MKAKNVTLSFFLVILLVCFTCIGGEEFTEEGMSDNEEEFTVEISPQGQIAKAPELLSVSNSVDPDKGPREHLQSAWLNMSQYKSVCDENVVFDYGLETRVGAALIYCYFANVIDYAAFEKLSGMKIFLSGPHTNGQLDLKNKGDFGYYNPEFLRWFAENALPLNNFAGNETAKWVYHRYFSHLIPVYYAVKLKLNANPKIYEDEVVFYRKLPHSESYDHNDPRVRYSNFITMEKPDYAYTFISEATQFWLRRKIDGTHDLFEKMMQQFLQVWDPKTYETLQKTNWKQG